MSESSFIITKDSPEIQWLCKRDKRLAKVIYIIGDIEYSLYEDGFSFLIHEIIEQMLSKTAGAKIYSRLESLCDGNITPHIISELSEEAIRSTGTSSAKTAYMKNVSAAVLSGSLNLDQLQYATDEEVRKALTVLRGIGNWTAKMYLIFVLGRANILPYEDGAFLQSYRWLYKTDDCSPSSIQKKCSKWSPYSSVASRYLYRALDTGLTKKEFHLYK